ncbi:hypothetical protein KFL_009830030 [Klebsormidium nitens]|uniref:Dirigent protein n=1 Tax=Klebsormidium nitens TaxID=105231 RepID=A0A1Y1IUI0_KLENI|nr:hypothetical protein KFL_009830030 [Klebsormidium nitens]|eukprot:GAQ92337.1 hypothetical protein KFL_009830030 [Klebsormidium nitens]
MAAFQLPYPALLIGALLLCLAVPRVEGAYYELSQFAEVFSPKGPRQSEFPSKLGEPFSFNNDMRLGDKSGATVGFTNGNCLVSAEVSPGIENTLYTCYETVVFTGGPYQGSSLTIVGFYDFFANGPLAIVGGTGIFRGATGELNYVYPSAEDFSYSIPNMVFVTADFPTPTPPTQAPSVTPSPTSNSTLAPSATPAPTPSWPPPRRATRGATSLTSASVRTGPPSSAAPALADRPAPPRRAPDTCQSLPCPTGTSHTIVGVSTAIRFASISSKWGEPVVDHVGNGVHLLAAEADLGGRRQLLRRGFR